VFPSKQELINRYPVFNLGRSQPTKGSGSQLRRVTPCGQYQHPRWFRSISNNETDIRHILAAEGYLYKNTTGRYSRTDKAKDEGVAIICDNMIFWKPSFVRQVLKKYSMLGLSKPMKYYMRSVFCYQDDVEIPDKAGIQPEYLAELLAARDQLIKKVTIWGFEHATSDDQNFERVNAWLYYTAKLTHNRQRSVPGIRSNLQELIDCYQS
jgi:hypothetical protein